MSISLRDIDQEQFVNDFQTMPNAQLAVRYNVNVRTIQNWARQLGIPPKSPALGARTVDGPATAFPANAGDDFDLNISIERNRVLILGDSEVPDHSIPMFEMVVSIAEKFGIKTLIINGDFVALDSFSRWARTQVNKVFFKQEREAALVTLEAFLHTFSEIYLDSGNHERRLPATVDGQISFGDFLQQLAGVEFSDYSHIDLKSGGREILVCHQKNFSIVPLSVPAKLAISRQKNIWCAHNHRLAWGYDPSGRLWLVEGGHCRDEKKTHYKQLRVTTHPMWNPGFGFCIDGMPYLVNADNFDFWMSLKPPQIASEMKKKTAPKKKNTK